ncbi:MAG: hypothetical protein EOM90_01755 [Alphaproteobacteria bacterium]|nr:hypothetical protein [Alphaproteobacteria bacterium]
MQIQQLTLFPEKASFNPASFDSVSNNEIFVNLANSVYEAFFTKFLQIDITEFDITTRANMLNNLVIKTVEKNCTRNDFNFIPSLTFTRRGFFILNDEYLLFLKKHPISNIKTAQDDLIKAQNLYKHIVFLVYKVDVFWSSIDSIKLQYIKYGNILYEKNITNFVQSDGLSIRVPNIPINPSLPQFNIKVKDELIKKKDAK